jgi:hypothetical protein
MNSTRPGLCGSADRLFLGNVSKEARDRTDALLRGVQMAIGQEMAKFAPFSGDAFGHAFALTKQFIS